MVDSTDPSFVCQRGAALPGSTEKLARGKPGTLPDRQQVNLQNILNCRLSMGD